MKADDIVNKWPLKEGKTQRQSFAEDIGVEAEFVRHWLRRGAIPYKYFPAIVEAAAARGVRWNGKQITLEMLFRCGNRKVHRAPVVMMMARAG